jgi:hypothetical protein
MDSYFTGRYRPVGETIAPRTLWGAVFIALLAARFLAFYIPLAKGRGDASQGVKCIWHFDGLSWALGGHRLPLD